jgi:SNF2 family DNA or RNA helicase
MTYTAHEYQQYASDFIETHPVAAILLACGLGKTIITLTAVHNLLFDSFEVRKVLVIAPLRVARDTWPAEIGKWDHLQLLRASVAVGSTTERLSALERKADLYIINRENVQWLIEESALPFDFDMVVVDELSSFKNHRSKRFRALMKRRPLVKRIVGLTGTPASNGLIDLWAQFKLLDKGVRLGRFIGSYREAYFSPDRRHYHLDESPGPHQDAGSGEYRVLRHPRR